jgi:hypothetical protein
LVLKLDPLVSQIIVATNFDHFTTADVRSLYLSLKNDSALDRSVVRRHIYSELLKLVKKGWLTRIVAKKKGFTRFSKTGLFNVNALQLKDTDLPEAPLSDAESKKQQLLVKLNDYKNEFLLSLGESEAYKDLYSELPELVDEIQPKYNKARDTNTKLLGKIRAIEGLLNQDKLPEHI